MPTKTNWNTIPWSEAEFVLTFNQNCVFKAALRKDFYNRKKLNSFFQKDVRCNLLTIRKYSERKRPTLMFQKTISRPNSHFNSFFFEFLKFKTLSSSQKFKLASILSENSYFAEGFFQANFLSSFFHSLNDLFLQRKYPQSSGKKIYEREKVFSFYLKRLFKVFPTQASLQAFQFYWILLLAREERFQYIFEPESESLVEPNLKSPILSDGSRLEYQPLQSLKNFIESSFFQFFSSAKEKANVDALRFKSFYEKRNSSLKQKKNLHLNKHFFLKGSFNSNKISRFKKKLERFQFLFKEMTLYSLERVRGFFFDIFSERKACKKPETSFLQPFFLSGLDLDIKKLEQSKKIFSLKSRDKFLNKKNYSLTEYSKVFRAKLEFVGSPLNENLKRFQIYPQTSNRLLASSFLLLGSEQEFLLFHETEKSFTNCLKFVKNWILISFANLSLNSLDLSNLKTGIQFQNHSVTFAVTKTISFYPTFSNLAKDDKLEILPSKSYQNRFLQYVKKILILSRGKSSIFLIRYLRFILFFWGYSIFFAGEMTSIRKIFRKIDSLLLFQIFKWARRNHPNWSRQKVVNRYFPSGNVWNYKRKIKRENWVFSDSSIQPITCQFLPKLSWLNRDDFCQNPSPQILFTGVFQSRKVFC